jgi:sulfur-oxidizing protein SoxY|tara:strand:+ start:1154 stop:1606 length:453 start_codon:yes stop_codon:yes gene_type:complete
MLRRKFLKILTSGLAVFATGLLTSIKTFAEWNQKAFSAKDFNAAINAYFPNQNISESNKIQIGVYDEIENGAVVPIKVETDLNNVNRITIFADKNPNPLIANFNLLKNCVPFVSTRIKVSEPSNIIVVINADNKLYMAKKFIVVHENGCG